MIVEQSLMNEIADALRAYQQATANAASDQGREDYLRLVAITEKLMVAIEAGDVAGAKLSLLGFSRQVSDSFATQPVEFKALARRVAEVQKHVI